MLEDADAHPSTSSDDAFSADRFTVDQDEWADAPGAPAPSTSVAEEHRVSPRRLLVRLLLVVGISLVAFHHSVGSVLQGVAAGSVVVYVLVVPVYAALAGVAISRRAGFEPASRTCLRDLLLGAVVCLVGVGTPTLLGPGLSGVYGLWRVDLLMLWLFLLGATVLCFGLRQVLRAWVFWAVALLLWPFPVRLANAALSGAVGGAAVLTVVVLAVVAYGHRSDDPPRWRVLGSAAGASGLVLLLAGLTTHPQRLWWPSVVAVGVATAWWAGRGTPGTREPVVDRRLGATAPVLVALGLVGLAVLPAAPATVPPSVPTGITSLALGPVVVPGFATTGSRVSREQQRYFGTTSTSQRFFLRQGDPRTGPAPDGRDIVVDVISTPRPQSLALYPVVTTYPMGTLSSIPDAEVDLGHGVAGQLFRAEDSHRHLAYTVLTFSWRLPVDMSIAGGYTGPPAQLNQRITLIAVDDHRDGAAFPEPGNATLDGIRAALASVGKRPQPRAGSNLRADEQLLDDTARALVQQRLTGG